MGVTAGRAVAGVGVVLAFVTIWIGAIPGASYWSSDGTTGAFVLALACLAALALAAAVAGRQADGALVACGAVLLGYYLFVPAVFAFDHLDVPGAGTWLAVCAGGLIVIGAGTAALASDSARGTPVGLSPAGLAAGLGIALVFPGIFLDATSDGDSYWTSAGIGHSLGVLLLILAIGSALAWAAGVAGADTRGVDVAFVLVLLGYVSFFPVDSAFNSFGSLDVGAWLAFGGGVLAAAGTWVARGAELPQPVTATA